MTSVIISNNISFSLTTRWRLSLFHEAKDFVGTSSWCKQELRHPAWIQANRPRRILMMWNIPAEKKQWPSECESSWVEIVWAHAQGWEVLTKYYEAQLRNQYLFWNQTHRPNVLLIIFEIRPPSVQSGRTLAVAQLEIRIISASGCCGQNSLLNIFCWTCLKGLVSPRRIISPLNSIMQHYAGAGRRVLKMKSGCCCCGYRRTADVPLKKAVKLSKESFWTSPGLPSFFSVTSRGVNVTAAQRILGSYTQVRSQRN